MFSVLLAFVPLTLLAASAASDTRPRIVHKSLAKRMNGEVAKRYSSTRWSFYDVGLGACGKTNVASDYIVALNAEQFGSGYPGPNCFKQITMNYNGKTATATIMDRCPGCPFGGLDLSRGLFTHFASEDEGIIYGEWSFVGDAPVAAYVAPTTTTKAWVAPTTTTKAWVAPTTSTKAWVAPTTTTKAWVAPTTTTKAWVAPTTSTKARVAPTTSTKAWVAPTTTSKAWVAPTTSSTKVWVAPTTSSTSVRVAPTTSSTNVPTTSSTKAPATSSAKPSTAASASSSSASASSASARVLSASFASASASASSLASSAAALHTASAGGASAVNTTAEIMANLQAVNELITKLGGLIVSAKLTESD